MLTERYSLILNNSQSTVNNAASSVAPYKVFCSRSHGAILKYRHFSSLLAINILQIRLALSGHVLFYPRKFNWFFSRSYMHILAYSHCMFAIYHNIKSDFINYAILDVIYFFFQFLQIVLHCIETGKAGVLFGETLLNNIIFLKLDTHLFSCMFFDVFLLRFVQWKQLIRPSSLIYLGELFVTSKHDCLWFNLIF